MKEVYPTIALSMENYKPPNSLQGSHLKPEGDHAQNTRQNNGGSEQALGSGVTREHHVASGTVLSGSSGSARGGTGSSASGVSGGRILVVSLSKSGERRAGVNSPATRGRLRAVRVGNGRGGTLISRQRNTGRVQGGPLSLEVGEIRGDRGRGTRAGVAILNESVSSSGVGDGRTIADQTVVVGLLDPLINNRTGPGTIHLRAKNSSLVVKGTGGRGVATSLGEEDGNGVTSSVLLELIVTGNSVARLAAPLVGVQRVEVQALGGVRVACHVVLQHGAELRNVGSGVSNWDLTVTLLITVGLHIAGGGQDIGGGNGTVDSGQDLVSDKETGGVVVLLELIENGREMIILGLIPVRSSLLPTLR